MNFVKVDLMAEESQRTDSDFQFLKNSCNGKVVFNQQCLYSICLMYFLFLLLTDCFSVRMRKKEEKCQCTWFKKKINKKFKRFLDFDDWSDWEGPRWLHCFTQLSESFINVLLKLSDMMYDESCTTGSDEILSAEDCLCLWQLSLCSLFFTLRSC